MTVNAVKRPFSELCESVLQGTRQHQVTARQAWALLLRSLPMDGYALKQAKALLTTALGHPVSRTVGRTMRCLSHTDTDLRGAGAGIRNKEHLAHGAVSPLLQNLGLASVSNLCRNARKAHLEDGGNFVSPEPSLQSTKSRVTRYEPAVVAT